MTGITGRVPRAVAALAALGTLSACADLGTRAAADNVGERNPPVRAYAAESRAPLTAAFSQTYPIGHVGTDAATTLSSVAMPSLADADADVIRGDVSWYGPRFAGRRTANGETFDPAQLTMAHRELPFGTRVRVTNPANGQSVVVRVNDRGPYVGDRVADLSHAAAKKIGMVKSGVIPAELEVLEDGGDPDASAETPPEPRS